MSALQRVAEQMMRQLSRDLRVLIEVSQQQHRELMEEMRASRLERRESAQAMCLLLRDALATIAVRLGPHPTAPHSLWAGEPVVAGVDVQDPGEGTSSALGLVRDSTGDVHPQCVLVPETQAVDSSQAPNPAKRKEVGKRLAAPSLPMLATSQCPRIKKKKKAFSPGV